jgi:hypothetical protein
MHKSKKNKTASIFQLAPNCRKLGQCHNGMAAVNLMQLQQGTMGLPGSRGRRRTPEKGNRQHKTNQTYVKFLLRHLSKMFETFPLQAALGFAGSSTVESYLVPQSQRGQN